MIELRHRIITGGSAGPRLLITGGVHGDEYEPIAAIRRLMKLIDSPRLRGSVTLVPVVNEPAFWRGTRTGDDGLDLARTCPGNANASMTHRIAHALSKLIRASDFYIDLHTGGIAYDIYPLTGYMLHDDKAVLDQQRRMARTFNLPLVWGTSAKLDGRSLSVARDAKVPAIYAEHGGGGACDAAGVHDYVDGCLNVMGELGMMDHPPPRSRVRHVIEDARDRSGHLQVQHPAPIDGFFEPAVTLGDVVQAGQLLGHVYDFFGEDEEPVRAAEAGIVLMLRAINKVSVGEALAAIAATTMARENES
jgi:predicted deacylase